MGRTRMAPLLVLLATVLVRFSEASVENRAEMREGSPRSWASWQEPHKREVGTHSPQEPHVRPTVEIDFAGGHSTIRDYWRPAGADGVPRFGQQVLGPVLNEFLYAGLGMIVGGLGVAWLIQSGALGAIRWKKSKWAKVPDRKTSLGRSLSLDHMVSECEGSTCDTSTGADNRRKKKKRGDGAAKETEQEKEKENARHNPNEVGLRTSMSVPDLSMNSIPASPRETTESKHQWNKCIEFSGNLGQNGVWPMASAETESSCHAIDPSCLPVEPLTPSSPLKPEAPDVFGDWTTMEGDPKFFHRHPNNMVVVSPVGTMSGGSSAVIYTQTDPELTSVFKEIRTSLHKQEKRKLIKERWAHAMDSLQWGAAVLNVAVFGCVIAFGRWQYLVGGCPNPTGIFDVNGYIDLISCFAKEAVLLVVGVPLTLYMIKAIITSNFFRRKNPLATPLLLIVFLFLGVCEAVAVGIAGGSTNFFMGCWFCYSLLSVWHTKVIMRSPLRRAKAKDLPDDEAESGLCMEDDSAISSFFLALLFPAFMGVLPFWHVGLSDCLAGKANQWWPLF
ncbi:hypothetical protein BSKO_01647 [Bryopsis sp. KO-2023]|nr:hypothetical protein BSKO_01647 [Bryopsis sp. KO-2023]